MKTNSNFGAARNNGASPAGRSDPASKPFSNELVSLRWSDLRQCLEDLPVSRPDRVLRAKMLIVDPGYPPDDMVPILAHRLAAQLTSETDSLPT